MIVLQALPVRAVEAKLSASPSDSLVLPRLNANFTTHTRYAIFGASEPVALKVILAGRRALPDTLEWRVTDYRDRQQDRGQLPVPAGESAWTTVLDLKNYGAGYFEVHLKMKTSGITLAKRGSRRAGIAAYGVLTEIVALPLKHLDESRFGAQGTNYLKADANRQGNKDPLDPIYPLLGVKWVYKNQQLGMLFEKGIDAWKPRLNKEYHQRNHNYAGKAGCAILVDLHSIPEWLWKVTPGANTKGNRTQAGQRFAPKDLEPYKAMIAKVVSEQILRQKICFPSMAKNYYQIHWEPDWHWKGSDDEFIAMYQAAYEVIHKYDQKGLLLGPNYGVLRKGNKLLKRLLAKGLGKYMDGVLIHTYYMTKDGRKSLPEDMKEVVDMTRQYLPAGAKIMNTEWGTNWRKPPEEDPEALRKEAASFMTGHLITLGEGVDSTWFFYTADSGKRGGGLLYNLSLDKFKYGATHVAPKPIFMAAATATRLLEGTQSLGRMDYLDPNVLGYAFDRAGEKVVCLWSEDKKNRRLTLPVGSVTSVTLVDPMGNSRSLPVSNGIISVAVSAIPTWIRGIATNALPFPEKKVLNAFAGDRINLNKTGNPCLFIGDRWVKAGSKGELAIPGNTAEGRKLVGLFSPGTETLTGTSLVDVKPSLEIALNKTIRPGLLTFDLKNQQKRPVTGMVELKAGEESIETLPVSVAPGQTVELVFQTRQVAAGSRTKAVLTDSHGARCSFAAPSLKKILPGSRALSAPKIDGHLDDWLLEMFNSVGEASKAKLSAQMNVRIAAQYDEKALYLAVKMAENDHIQTQHPTGLWHQDSIQIGLAVHPEGKVWKSWQKFGIGQNSVNGFRISYRDLGNAFPYGRVGQKEISWAFVHSGDESFYEIRIPWTQVDKGLTGPPAEGLVGFGVMVNNVDLTPAGKKGARQHLDVMGGMNLSRSEDFGILELK
jgi:hypothetical protein